MFGIFNLDIDTYMSFIRFPQGKQLHTLTEKSFPCRVPPAFSEAPKHFT